FTLAALQTHLENKSKAELALQRILSVEPGSREARHVLAAVHGEALLTPDDDYSREAFDRIAPQFDNQQLRVRKYRAPVDVARLIEEHEPERRSIESVLD